MLCKINAAAAERSGWAKATPLSEQQAEFAEQMATNIHMVANTDIDLQDCCSRTRLSSISPGCGESLKPFSMVMCTR
jgi:hypothetical protein